MDTNAVAMSALLAKLYKTFTAPDEVTNTPSFQQYAYFTFAAPGIPVTDDSFNFLKFANLGQVNAASNFAQFVNFIPNSIGFWSSGGSEVWDAYKVAVNQAVVKPLQITQEQQDQLDAADSVLFQSIRRVDPKTGAIVHDRSPSQKLSDYYVAYQAYISALRSYNDKLIYVNTHPDDQAAVQDWTLNGPNYEQDVRVSLNAFSVVRGVIEDAQATIAQITGSGASTYFQQLKNTMEFNARKDGTGATYYPTVYFPDQFWKSNSWSRFTFGEEEIHTYSNDTSTSWGGGASGSWGLWSAGLSVSHKDIDHYDSSETKNLKIEVELIQVPILRPWMDATLFTNRSWRFADPQQTLSNGLAPPATAGMLPMYATSMILARKLSIALDMTSTQNSKHTSETHASGSVGWGPFSLRGGYDRVSTTATHDYHSTDSGITCEGMQIIAFVCAVVPPSPIGDKAHLRELAIEPILPVRAESFSVI